MVFCLFEYTELSEVLWSMVMSIGLKVDVLGIGAVLIWGTFIGFAELTLGILIFMEGLSAFLHTLRLHW